MNTDSCVVMMECRSLGTMRSGCMIHPLASTSRRCVTDGSGDMAAAACGQSMIRDHLLAWIWVDHSGILVGIVTGGIDQLQC